MGDLKMPIKGPACPWCGNPSTAETVDNGVGEQQIEPFGCEWCQASEICYPDTEATHIALGLEVKDGWSRQKKVT